jgi:DNA-binding NarL/FixJ family response regulator
VHRIVVVDDFRGWRQTVSKIVEQLPDFEVVGEAADGEEAVQLAEQLKPDLIVLDIGMPKLNGVEAAKRIFHVSPASKVIFLSQENDLDTIQAVLSLGASAYVNKIQARTQLPGAITTALDPVVAAPQPILANS